MRRVLAAGLILLLVAPSAFALEPPRNIMLQGMVETSGGAPANGDFQMTFELFPAPSGGTAAYTQDVSTVHVAGGAFDVELGPLPSEVPGSLDELWLQTTVEGEVLQPRRPVRAVVFALHAEHAVSADWAAGVTCTECIDSTALAFGWAASAGLGGDASGLACITACVDGSELEGGSVTGAHVQDGSLTKDDVDFPFAGSLTQGGAANGVACTTPCVDGNEVVSNIQLSGDVKVTGSFTTCAPGYSGCSLALGTKGTVEGAGDGWLYARAQSGLRVRTLDDQA